MSRLCLCSVELQSRGLRQAGKIIFYLIMNSVYQKIILDSLSEKNLTEDFFSKIKKRSIKNTPVKKVPQNVLLLKIYKKMLAEKKMERSERLEFLLKKRRVRTLSGIASVSVILHPFGCSGKCIFCPTERNLPKSYLKNEPAVMRAIANNYNPFRQVRSRLDSLKKTGHSTDKIELVVIGGTWSFYPHKYRLWYLTRCLEAFNGERGGNKNNSPKILPRKSIKWLKKRLFEEQKINENAKNRVIGITLETRPDFINKEEIIDMRECGATRIELGIQHTDEDILRKNKRDQSLKGVSSAIKMLKDAGFKITFHLMPGLYGSSPQKDIKMFKKVFKDSNLRPDYIKIYPCVVLKNTPLFRLWKNKKYKPLIDNQLIDLIIKLKRVVPLYTRIIRIIRDIPSNQIIAGGRISNLREKIEHKMKRDGEKCACIRCREIKDSEISGIKPVFFRQNYRSSGGKEVFLSFENKKRDCLLSFLRLRVPSQVIKKEKHFIKELEDASIIREVHTYGPAMALKEKSAGASQHHGFGKQLIKKAEQISKREFRLKKIAVIPGIGTKKYYRKLGYRSVGTYMIKRL